MELELGQVLLEVINIIVLLSLGIPGCGQRWNPPPSEDGHHHRSEEGEQQQHHHRDCQVVRYINSERDLLLHSHLQRQICSLALYSDDESLAFSVALRVEVKLGEGDHAAILLKLSVKRRYEGVGSGEVGLEASFSPEVESNGLEFLLADAHGYADELVLLNGSDVEVADAAAVEQVGLGGVRERNC